MEIILFKKVKTTFWPFSQTFGKQGVLTIQKEILNVLSISPSSSPSSHKKLLYLTTKNIYIYLILNSSKKNQ